MQPAFHPNGHTRRRNSGNYQSIFVGAFNPQAFTGGVVGSFFLSMKKGVSRGIFSNGAELTISGFTHTYGNWVSIFTAIALCCFAFSTILGWGLYGARCIEFIFGEKVIKPFMVVYSLVSIVGAVADLGLIWGISDTCNGLMAIPNLIALFLLSGTVAKLTKEHFKK